ncbi:MAG: hypothetical protein AAGI48_08925 [Verrucomicrobiota bacterium]
MKSGILLFSAGLALGIAAALIITPSSDTSPNPVTGETPSATTGKSHSGREHGDSKTRRHLNKAGRKAGRAGRGGDPMEELLLTLGSIEDEEQLDPMLIIRQAMRLTRTGEAETIDILNRLSQPLPNPIRDEQQFRSIITVIAFSRLCELNGPEAMNMIADGAFGDEMKDELAAIGMNSWVAADPEGAQRWFEGILGEADTLLVEKRDGIEPPEMLSLLDNEDLRKAYFNGMAKHDPEAIEERIQQFESADVRDAMREDLTASLIAHEHTADGLLMILEKSTDLHDSRVSAVEKLAEIDLDSAAEWVASQPPDKARDHEVTTVGMKLMEDDLENGSKWFMSQEIQDPEMAKARMSRIAYRFANEGLDRAVDWVNRQPDSPIRDHAEVAVAWMHAKQDDWPTTMTWLADVSDRQTRENTLNQMFERNWDKSEQQLDPELLSAAEAAGFGKAAQNYTPD